ncbi:hypothetical protein T492DRAFT_862133 [Pavlovales sp. CCMP2436]|nr:hypothetical protein T492DRAFT_862133 [Pavlovales sp. CCMP2436]
MATLEPREGGGGAEGEPHGAMVAACRVAVDEAWGRLSEVVSGVVDEEDGVFLYKLTRLAQAYPEVTQCVIERREAVVATLVDQLDPVRSSLVSRVQRALLDHSEEQFQLWRAREAARGKVDSEKLETQRVAASMELAHKDLELAKPAPFYGGGCYLPPPATIPN